jgi:hypothetical protein
VQNAPVLNEKESHSAPTKLQRLVGAVKTDLWTEELKDYS